MKHLLESLTLSVVMSATSLSAQEAPASLDTCRAENSALKAEVARFKTEVDQLNGAILVLSKQLGTGPAPVVAAKSTPSKSGKARLKVTITTKYNIGQACAVSIDDHEVSRIDYPTLEGKGRVMEYSSGYIDVTPGDHRVALGCADVKGKKQSAVYTDQAFGLGEEYVFHTKINVWSKALQQESFGSK